MAQLWQSQRSQLVVLLGPDGVADAAIVVIGLTLTVCETHKRERREQESEERN